MNISPSESQEISTRLSGYDYQLPRDLIAQKPLENRNDSRLLILHRDTGKIEHRKFHEITNYLLAGDLLVLNNTKVMPAQIIGKKPSGASVELLLIEEQEKNRWRAFIKSNAKLRKGEIININHDTISLNLSEKFEDGSWSLIFNSNENIKELLHQIGKMPLPPYIKRARNDDPLSPFDRKRYQTVFAQKEGAIAAPTAGLHFSPETLAKIKHSGVEIAYITLHVGIGTFLPIKTDDIRDHHMHREYYECSEEIIRTIKKTRGQKGRVIATGSTSCRVLETIAGNTGNNGTPQLSGWTNLFIYPPYDFKYVDALITNFHLPKTTLLLLVSAFAGRKNIMNAYETAISEGYRFFSYGDCMIIL
ncbi:MAG TPA: tRNA preQ1(34) S-adenosylmethionine ribosyltransferase-isomerase QueA [Candidatus Brocadiaceae bacterium]